MPQHLRRKLMLPWMIKIIGSGILVAILSMIVAAVFFGKGTEKDVTFIYMAMMDFVVIAVIARAVLKRIKKFN